MTQFPDFMWLGGDENGGVWLICDHHGCQTGHYALAHHGGHGQQDAEGVPHFSARHLDGFVTFARKHAQLHTEDGAR